MTDQNIKRFTLEGTSKDSGVLAASRDEYERHIIVSMQDEGYVPVLDLAPVLRIEYDEKRDVFNWILTVQGVFVGKRRAAELLGVSNGRVIKKSTPPNKSSQ